MKEFKIFPKKHLLVLCVISVAAIFTAPKLTEKYEAKVFRDVAEPMVEMQKMFSTQTNEEPSETVLSFGYFVKGNVVCNNERKVYINEKYGFQFECQKICKLLKI